MEQIIRNSKELGMYVRRTRIKADLSRSTVAAFSGVGKRFIYDLENGKPTTQIGKILQVMSSLAITVIVRPREFGRG